MKSIIRLSVCGHCVVLGLAVGLLAADMPPSINSPDPQERIQAVRNISDQALLAKIAVESKDESLRYSAVTKLTDAALLAKVALGSNDWSVRNAAVKKLTDEAVLAKIAVEDKDSYVREAAVTKVTDQVLLAKVAMEDDNTVVRSAAFDKLTDQSLRAKVVADRQWHSFFALLVFVAIVVVLVVVCVLLVVWLRRKLRKRRMAMREGLVVVPNHYQNTKIICLGLAILAVLFVVFQGAAPLFILGYFIFTFGLRAFTKNGLPLTRAKRLTGPVAWPIGLLCCLLASYMVYLGLILWANSDPGKYLIGLLLKR